MSKSKSFFKYISMHFAHIYNVRDTYRPQGIGEEQLTYFSRLTYCLMIFIPEVLRVCLFRSIYLFIIPQVAMTFQN